MSFYQKHWLNICSCRQYIMAAGESWRRGEERQGPRMRRRTDDPTTFCAIISVIFHTKLFGKITEVMKKVWEIFYEKDFFNAIDSCLTNKMSNELAGVIERAIHLRKYVRVLCEIWNLFDIYVCSRSWHTYKCINFKYFMFYQKFWISLHVS